VLIFFTKPTVGRGGGAPEAMEQEVATALEREITAVFLEGQSPDKNALN